MPLFTENSPSTTNSFFVKSGIIQRDDGARRWAVLDVLPIAKRRGAAVECRFSRKKSRKKEGYYNSCNHPHKPHGETTDSSLDSTYLNGTGGADAVSGRTHSKATSDGIEDAEKIEKFGSDDAAEDADADNDDGGDGLDTAERLDNGDGDRCGDGLGCQGYGYDLIGTHKIEYTHDTAHLSLIHI